MRKTMDDNIIKKLRKEKELTQTQLADFLSISQQAVAKWENGQARPNTEMLVKLSNLFHVSVDSILDQRNSAHPNLFAVPVIGSVRAGYHAYAYEEELGEEWIEISDGGDYRCLVVKGDSMLPYIKEGDLAVIKCQSNLENGDLGVIVFGEEEGTLKRFFKKDNQIILEPFNSAYETLVLSGEALDRFYIFGKVIETRTKW